VVYNSRDVGLTPTYQCSDPSEDHAPTVPSTESHILREDARGTSLFVAVDRVNQKIAIGLANVAVDAVVDTDARP
jgi:hypothetical protein